MSKAVRFDHYGDIDALEVREVERPVPGELEVPIAGVFALDDVQRAYRTLEQQHTPGKLVLRP